MNVAATKAAKARSEGHSTSRFFATPVDDANAPFFPSSMPQLRRKCKSCEAEAERRIQPKFLIGKPDDRFEQEADRVADQVVNRQPAEFAVSPGTGISGVSHGAGHALLQRRLEHEDTEDDSLGQATPQEDQTIQLTPQSAVSTSPLASAAGLITGMSNGGEPLPSSARSYFEPRFDRDFSQVRIHRDATSSEFAGSINARAFTFGNHIAFGSGQYSHNSSQGRHLLAHELTHTIQQRSAATHSTPLIQRKAGNADRDDCGDDFTFKFIGKINSEKEEHHRYVPRFYYAHIPQNESPGTQFEPLTADADVFAGELSGKKKNGLWRSVCMKSETIAAPRQILWVLDEYMDNPAVKPTPVPTPGKSTVGISAEDDIKQIFKAGWREVNELGIAYQQDPVPKGGAKLRAATGGHGRVIRHLPPNSKVFILRQHAKQKVSAVTTLGSSGGEFGYIASDLLARHLPDPESDILQISSGDTPLDIARKHYSSKGFNVWGKDPRYVVSALAWVNQHAKHNFPGKSGIRKAGKLSDPWYTAEATADHYIWLPGKDHLNALYETIAEHGGGTGSITGDIWRGVKKVGEYLAYGAAFVGGLVHGFVKSLYDAIAGLVGLGVDVLTSIFTGNVLKDVGELSDAVSKMTWKDIKEALGAFAYSWEKKLNSNSPWTAGHAHGFLTGYIMAEAAQLLITAGQIAYLKAAIWGSRLGKAIKATRSFQALAKGIEKTGAGLGKGKKLLGEAGAALRKTKPFKAVTVAKEWIKDALVLSANTVRDLGLDGINKLRTLSDDALSTIRKLSQPIKRTLLGCTSPCKVNLDDIKNYLASIAGKGGAGAKKLTSIDDVLKAIPDIFDKTTIAAKLKKHKTLMEAIKRAEITSDELAVMAKFFTGADKANPATAYRTFVRTLTSLVPAKIGPDIKKFNELAEALVKLQRRMGSAVKGSMFETFAKLHLGRFKNLTFGRATFSKIEHSILKKTRTSDGFIDSAGALWDFKHVAGKVPKKQVTDYLNIMAMKLKSTDGKIAKSVNYLFPTEAVAKLNADLLGKGINVFFVSGKNTVSRFTP